MEYLPRLLELDGQCSLCDGVDGHELCIGGGCIM